MRHLLANAVIYSVTLIIIAVLCILIRHTRLVSHFLELSLTY